MKKIIIAILILSPLVTNAKEPKILINEIAWMGTTNSSNDEWIELYNNTDTDIDLTGWKLEAVDGSPSITLEGMIVANDFFILERTDDDSVPEVIANQIYSGSLGNTGEYLKLIDHDEVLIDEIDATGGWPGGNNSTKRTMERKNISTWQTSLNSGGTPKAANSETEEIEEPTEDEPENTNKTNSNIANNNVAMAKKEDIIITELFPDPAGIDSDNEFIEIKNVSQAPIDITGWRLSTSAKQSFIIPSWKLYPKAILTFYRSQTNLALSNAKDKVSLYTDKNKLISSLGYKKVMENQSLQIDGDLEAWQDPSPNKPNIIEEIILPQANIIGPTKAQTGEIISFDGSDSFDPKNRNLKYLWNFGDGRQARGILTKQIYIHPGKYTVSLNTYINDNVSSTDKLTITVSAPETGSAITPSSTPHIDTIKLTPPFLDKIPFIFISEFLPDPKGSDTEEEFIELFNNEGKTINLSGWQIDDEDGGSKPYTFDNEVIKPGQYLALWRSQTKLALNNDKDSIRLIAPDGRIVDVATYNKTDEGVSYILDENFIWLNSATPTPGEINVLNEINTDTKTNINSSSTPKVLGVKQQNSEITKQPSSSSKNKYMAIGSSVLVILGLGALKNIKKKKL